MSRAQRLTFLGIAVVIAVVAVVLLTRGDATTDTASTPTATPTASAAPSQEEASPIEPEDTPEPTPTPDPVKTLETGKVTKLKFTEGQTVRFQVASDQAEEIHVHGYDIEDEVQPGKPLKVAFKADITGVFEIELHGSGEQIGQLSVEPK